jgi:hypothetical protein
MTLLAIAKLTAFRQNMRVLNRRQFLESATVGGIACLSSRPGTWFAPGTLRIGVLVDDSASDVSKGIRLGSDEAIRSASLFGKRLEVLTEVAQRDSDTEARALLGRHPVVLVSGLADAIRMRHLLQVVGSHDLWVLNAAATADTLRSPCARPVFHVAASDAMKAAATRSAAGPALPNDRVLRAVMWEPSLERFGAGQLNARFRSRFGTPMTGEAWAGWMAMKLAVESFLRTNVVDASILMNYAGQAGTRFDGHKGMPLSFRAEDHQLRQPMYVVGGEEVMQVPANGAPTANSADPLDALLGPVSAPCR